ncbi:MAG: hypothetical protein NTX63_00325 [Candidatus Peregrinibacteria bacterium]|nr:hypothetical protein [Candidatus Peregrinibacteria bacterium]
MAFTIDGPMTIEVAREVNPSVLRAHEAARRRLEERKAVARINGIQQRTQEAAKKAFLLDRVVEDKMIRIFEKTGLLKQPRNASNEEWDMYVARLDKLSSSSGGRELAEHIKKGWEPTPMFSASGGSIMVFFRTPDEPNVLCAKNFNIEVEDEDSARKMLENIRTTKMAYLRLRIDEFHQSLESMLELSISRSFSEAYLMFRQAVTLQDSVEPDIFELLPPDIQRHAEDFAGAVSNSMMAKMYASKQLPDPENILNLYRQEEGIFNHDVLQLRRLPEKILSYGSQQLDLSPGELLRFRQAMAPLLNE